MHENCPDCVEELKWSFPHFSYKGMLCSMAAFKQHCAFGFWNGALILGEESRASEAMGHLGRITSLKDLPPKATLAKWIRRAMALNDAGVKVARTPKTPRPMLKMPLDFSVALKKNKKAQSVFDAFSPSKRRDYIEWIVSAKADARRAERLKTAVGWIAQGKSRNWKYEK